MIQPEMYSRNGFTVLLSMVFVASAWEAESTLILIDTRGRVDFKPYCYFRSDWRAMESCFSRLGEFFHSLHILILILVIKSRKLAPFPPGFSQVCLFYCWSNCGVLQTHISFCVWVHPSCNSSSHLNSPQKELHFCELTSYLRNFSGYKLGMQIITYWRETV